ncbi:MAG: Hpt domain-containing protein [Campylobacterota bacterium]|nr:Hpt domain-containing protein [Campylobacterota bacterium]
MLDLQKIADELDFDLEDVEMLMEVFLKSVDENLKTVQDGVESSDFDAIFESAHAIKGSASNLTLMNISDIAKDIEHNAREKVSINYEEKFLELKKLIEEIKS